MKEIKRAFLLLFVVAGLSLSANASLLTNGDFDVDAVPNGGSIQTYTGWDNVSGLNYIVDPQTVSPRQPQSGENYWYAEAQSHIEQTSLTLTPGLQYRITAYVGNVPDKAYGGYYMYLFSGSFPFATAIADRSTGLVSPTYNVTQGPSGDTSDWTCVASPWYTAVAADAGKTYTLAVFARDENATGGWTGIDTVALEVVPEPATMCLLAFGGVLMTAARRRRR